ncbi:unnamed protein product [Rhizoctonia solani]|uniref:Zn(2)-C6 fungal-type domain-containing protein n=1 Tax=Rhizoctonia solani TaxID=456999 RepID=A0A8H2WRM6_9AGAM|nr:unnamed protein product [Rhizoctonia solani]
MLPRSTTGCCTCKRRKKKCDERQPTCFRCEKAGFECEGYAPLESPDSRGVMRRSKPTPASRPRHVAPVERCPRDSSLTRLSNASLSLEEHSTSGSLTNVTQDACDSDQPKSSTSLASNTPQPDPHSESLSGQDSSGRAALGSQAPNTCWNPDASLMAPFPTIQDSSGPQLSASSTPRRNCASGSNQARSESPSGLGYYSVGSNATNVFTVAFSNTDPLETPFGPSQTGLVLNFGPFSAPDWFPSVPHQQAYVVKVDEDSESEYDGYEGAEQTMCIAPTMDPNTRDNTLPFVLQCYARWVNLAVFDPRNVVDLLKNSIIEQFMRSQGERTRIILLANVIGILGKTINLNSKTLSLVSFLRTEAHEKLAKFVSPRSEDNHEVGMRDALLVLDFMTEVILIQRYCSPITTALGLMEAAGPVFRRACPEPPGEPVNLPRVLASGINLRHFATNDVIVSITTGRPMIIRYDVTYPPDILPQITDRHYGLRWLHGISDQCIILLARINILSEDSGFLVNQDIVAEIENDIQNAWCPSESSDEPLLTIMKYLVRECWVITMHVYLYMVLCRRSANDPEVVKLVNSFIRLLESVRPSRMPDSFLCIPMIIVGVSAFRKVDRAVIRRRMLGLQEVATPGACGYDALSTVLDVWSSADLENRPAVWSDLRVATYRVTGM